MKTFYFKISFSTVFIILFAINLFMIGCQQNEIENTSSNEVPFLEISPNVNLQDMSQEDWFIIKEAAKRLNFYIKNELLDIKQESGKSINMSEKLFMLFKKSIDKTNKNIATGRICINKPQTRWAGEFTDEWSEANCVAQAINGAFMAMGKSCDEPIDEWIREQYGNNGIPFDCMTEVLNHYFSGSQVSIPTDGFISGTSSAKSTIIVLRGESEAHAVNLISVSNGIITYMDYQQGEIRTGFVTSIIYVYNVYDAK